VGHSGLRGPRQRRECPDGLTRAFPYMKWLAVVRNVGVVWPPSVRVSSRPLVATVSKIGSINWVMPSTARQINPHPMEITSA
jgi:hypothetical protein